MNVVKKYRQTQSHAKITDSHENMDPNMEFVFVALTSLFVAGGAAVATATERERKLDVLQG